MNIDQHLSWLTSAVKASTEGDVVNREKLIKNVNNCFQRVKKALTKNDSGNQLFEDFRIKATLLLLLCCPRVNNLQDIKEDDDFSSLISTLPCLRESDFFAVVRNQKNYRFLGSLLSYLPPAVVRGYLTEYFAYVDEVNPVTLAITTELLKCFLFSCQNAGDLRSMGPRSDCLKSPTDCLKSPSDCLNSQTGDCLKSQTGNCLNLSDFDHMKLTDCVKVTDFDCLKSLTDFLSSKSISDENEAAIKSSGYYYLYLCECLYVVLSGYVGLNITAPDSHPCIEAWLNLWREKEDQKENQDNKEDGDQEIKSPGSEIKDQDSEIRDQMKDRVSKDDEIKDRASKDNEIKDMDSKDKKEDQIKVQDCKESQVKEVQDNNEDQIKTKEDSYLYPSTEPSDTFRRSSKDKAASNTEAISKNNEANIPRILSFIEAPIKALLTLCQDNIEAISVDVWMAWSEVNLPKTVQAHRESIHEHVRSQPQSIQIVIRNIAFDILEILDLCAQANEKLSLLNKAKVMSNHQASLNDEPNKACNTGNCVGSQQANLCNKSNEALSHLNDTGNLNQRTDLCNKPYETQVQLDDTHVLSQKAVLSQLNNILSTGKFSDLLNFLHQVALDPDHDPDEDLGLDQLVEEVNRLIQENMKGQRLTKLLGMLVEQEELFTCWSAVGCLRVGRSEVNTSSRVTLLKRFIPLAQSASPQHSEWLDVILELAEDLTCSEVLSVVEECLSYGLDECLQSSNFPQHLTAVFNQLAGQESKELKSVDRVAWLCLQSGGCVVEQAVTLAVTLTGLVPVMIQSLASIPTVCTAALPNGTTLLITKLLKHAEREKSEREERELVGLVRGLLGVPGQVLYAPEVLDRLVKPFLYLSEGTDRKKILLPLQLLKALVDYDADAVCQGGVALPSLLVTLARIADTTVYIPGCNSEHILTLRSMATQTLVTLTKRLLTQKDNFKTEMSLVKQAVTQTHTLHPRTLHPFSKLIDARLSANRSTLDVALWEVMTGAENCNREVKMRDKEMKMIDKESKMTKMSLFNEEGQLEELKSISRSEWIAVLVQLLPHCSESEWIAALFLTHHVLKYHSSVFPTLEVVQEVMFICSLLVLPSLPPKEQNLKMEKKGRARQEEKEEVNVEVIGREVQGKEEGEREEEEEDLRRREKEGEEGEMIGGRSRRGKKEKEEERETMEERREEEKEEFKSSLSSLSPSVPLSIQHCFQCFASAAMVYMESTICHLSSCQKFVYVCSVFQWWCCHVSSHQCDSTLPTIFLARLTASLEDMINSSRVKIVPAMSCELGYTNLGTTATGIDSDLGKSDLGTKPAVMNSEVGNSKVMTKTTGMNIESEKSDLGTEVGSSNFRTKSTVMNSATDNSDLDKKTSVKIVPPVNGKARKSDLRTKAAVINSTGNILNLVKRKNIGVTTTNSLGNKDEIKKTENDKVNGYIEIPSMANEEVLAKNGTNAANSFDCKDVMKEGENNKNKGNTKVKASVEIATKSNASNHTNNKEKKLSQEIKEEKNLCQEMKEEDFKREVERLMWCLVKYVPPNYLVASIANKLKKLYEM